MFKMKSIINNVFYGIYSSVMMERPEIQEQVGEFDQPKDLKLSLDVFPCYRSIVNKISESCFSVARVCTILVSFITLKQNTSL